jgi:hypothetical protein
LNLKYSVCNSPIIYLNYNIKREMVDNEYQILSNKIYEIQKSQKSQKSQNYHSEIKNLRREQIRLQVNEQKEIRIKYDEKQKEKEKTKTTNKIQENTKKNINVTKISKKKSYALIKLLRREQIKNQLESQKEIREKYDEMQKSKLKS